jgi:hypothetical protein
MGLPIGHSQLQPAITKRARFFDYKLPKADICWRERYFR